MAFYTQVPATGSEITSTELILIASAESRGEIDPCDCPVQPLGGLPRRASLLREVRDSGHPAVLIELGEVFPPAYQMSNSFTWAAALGTAYGFMGYNLVVFGDEDLALGKAVLDRFQAAFVAENPYGKVAVPPKGGAGYSWIRFDAPTRDQQDLSLSFLVVWPPVNPSEIAVLLDRYHEQADMKIAVIHGNLVAAKGLLADSTFFDHIVVGDGSKFDEVRRINRTSVSGPGIRGRTLSFARLIYGSKNDWIVAGYRLVPVTPDYMDDVVISEVIHELH
ncbi:MAG: hypothetical protein KJ927_01365 [Candidatus Eisenbacteria bacterium]|nr:hypothetical protein [Candidatus Eisenbacteria bacterium]